MHLYNRKNRIAPDRPQGINIPGGSRRLFKVVSGDTLLFTANVVVPSTREPVKKADLEFTEIYIAVAENRFNPVIWSGSAAEGWIRLDENRNGLIHVQVPRTVMGVLRRGSYAFSIVVDDGVVRETQLTGNFQIEYEPTGSINDIPYRNDQTSGNPISLTPELDLAAQKNSRLTYDQLVKAVDTISRTLIKDGRITSLIFGSSGLDKSVEEIDAAVVKLSQMIVFDDTLRSLIQTTTCEAYDPTYEEFVDRVSGLLTNTSTAWPEVPCTPVIG